LELIADQVKPFAGDARPNQFYWMTSKFRVAEVFSDHGMARLVTKVDNNQLFFDCSMKYFSGNSDFNAPMQLNSTNFAFFNDRLELLFETTFIVTAQRDNVIHGTPLYLILESQDGLII
jgi:hypothetical protein